jgi:hypothetical protein
LAFPAPTSPRPDAIDLQVRLHRQYGLEHYPNLRPEPLARLLRVEHGLILSDADVAAILRKRDERVRRSALADARIRAKPPGVLRALLSRLGL